MKSVFSEKYLPLKTEIDEVIRDFDNLQVDVPGSRNQIKTHQLTNGLVISIKSFKKPNLFNQIVYRFFRKSKAARSFIYGTYLLEHDLNTPDPVAYYEFPHLFTFNQSFYICEHLEYDYIFRDLAANAQLFDNWEDALKQFTRFTYKLHENNVEFLDHSPGNTLITNHSGTYEFSLVDLNRMNIKKPLSLERRIKNFAKLTHREDVMLIMSQEYARLMDTNVKDLFQTMLFYTKEFQYKWHLKQMRKIRFRRFKKKLGL